MIVGSYRLSSPMKTRQRGMLWVACPKHQLIAMNRQDYPSSFWRFLAIHLIFLEISGHSPHISGDFWGPIHLISPAFISATQGPPSTARHRLQLLLGFGDRLLGLPAPTRLAPESVDGFNKQLILMMDINYWKKHS